MSISAEKKEPSRRNSSISSRSSIAKSVIPGGYDRKGSFASVSSSSRKSVGSVTDAKGVLNWDQVRQRARRLMPEEKPVQQPQTFMLDHDIRIQDFGLRLLKANEPPEIRSLNDRLACKRYITNNQPAIAQKLVLEFTILTAQPIHCQIPLMNCGISDYDRDYQAAVKVFSMLISQFREDPTTSLVRLPDCIKLYRVMFCTDRVRDKDWAIAANVKIDTYWIDEKQTISEAYLVKYSSQSALGESFGRDVIVEIYIEGKQVKPYSRPLYPEKMRRSHTGAWNRWLGPPTTLESNPSIKYYPNVRAVNIKRNVVGEVLSCRLEEVKAELRVEQPRRGMGRLLQSRQPPRGKA